ncbi:cilia- and flagella-associated protein 119-like isoform X2 [Littorina saxatilis]|uniref:Uncharacterized protein n=1 Tax=Littorina saxatilis TaxID=31220 RepID=A0AAN9ALF2_9CAEN
MAEMYSETEIVSNFKQANWSDASLLERERTYGVRYSHATKYGLLLAPGSDTSSWAHLLQAELIYVFPRDHKGKVVVWADLTVDDIDRLNESLNVDHNKQVLADIFHLDMWREDPKQAIVMDLYYYTIQFARDNNFNREKTSTFFSIMKKTHEVAIETPFGNLEQTFRYFKELMLRHAVSRAPHSIELFNVDEVRKLTEYAINTYFRHFKMYKYAFTPLVRLDLSINYFGVPIVSPEPTEAGDIDEEGSKDQETATEDQLRGETSGPVEEESEARKELRAMIQTYLSEEIKKVKLTVEEQLKATEETLSKKLEAAEPIHKKSTRKDSAKKKK